MRGAIILILLLPLATAMSAEDCTDQARSCAEECEKDCNQKKYDYCRTYEYSGCALDVFCSCNACQIYDTKWCPQGYTGCAEGQTATYQSKMTRKQYDQFTRLVEAGVDCPFYEKRQR